MQQLVGHATQCFLAAVAIKLGRAFVPIRDTVSPVANKDCVIAQVEQQRSFRQRLLDLPSFRDVPRHLRSANHTARGILHRRNGNGNINQRTVLPHANGIEMLYPLGRA